MMEKWWLGATPRRNVILFFRLQKSGWHLSIPLEKVKINCKMIKCHKMTMSYEKSQSCNTIMNFERGQRCEGQRCEGQRCEGQRCEGQRCEISF